MRQILHTQIDIDAPVDVVWDILTDLERYQDWNPFVLYARGTILMGETLLLKPRLPGSRRQLKFTATVTTCEPKVEFAWTGIQIHPAISAGEHVFRLRPLAADRTRLIHDEVFSGVLAPVVMAVGGRQTRRGFELMNEACKLRAEQYDADA